MWHIMCQTLELSYFYRPRIVAASEIFLLFCDKMSTNCAQSSAGKCVDCLQLRLELRDFRQNVEKWMSEIDERMVYSEGRLRKDISSLAQTIDSFTKSMATSPAKSSPEKRVGSGKLASALEALSRKRGKLFLGNMRVTRPTIKIIFSRRSLFEHRK